MLNLLTAARKLLQGYRFAQAHLTDRCLAVVKFVTFGLRQILTLIFELTEISTIESARDQTGLKLATPAAPDIGLRIVEKYHTTAIYIHFA